MENLNLHQLAVYIFSFLVFVGLNGYFIKKYLNGMQDKIGRLEDCKQDRTVCQEIEKRIDMELEESREYRKEIKTYLADINPILVDLHRIVQRYEDREKDRGNQWFREMAK